MEQYVNSTAFDKECAAFSKEIDTGPTSDDSDSDHHIDLWETDPSSVNFSSVQFSPYDASKLEAHFYYFGIRGPRLWGPKLIFWTSKDVFVAPSGPEQDARRMQLVPVYEHKKLSKDNLWATIRSKVVELLDQRDIRHSSIDLVRFSRVEENEDVEDNQDDEDDDTKVVPCETVVTSPVTIWVGVLPDTLTGQVAFHSSNDILDLLKVHGVIGIDIAYRESVARSFSGPDLFAPVADLDPLKAVIDPVTTAPSLPITGLKTLKRQGTMGFYFRVDKALYAVTTCHVLFPEDEGNNTYSYVAGPKKEVVLMGTKAFTDFLVSIKGHIGTLNNTVILLEKRATALTARSAGGVSNAGRAVGDLAEIQHQLSKTQMAIKELKKFFLQMQKQWTKPKDRVIGHIVWAPPISFSTAPYGYTKDVCVIKLDEKKFSQNFRWNVLDLGPEINGAKFMSLMYPRNNAPSDFDYPDESLLQLRGILSAEEICTPDDKDHSGNPVRYVIKRGVELSFRLSTETTDSWTYDEPANTSSSSGYDERTRRSTHSQANQMQCRRNLFIEHSATDADGIPSTGSTCSANPLPTFHPASLPLPSPILKSGYDTTRLSGLGEFQAHKN